MRTLFPILFLLFFCGYTHGQVSTSLDVEYIDRCMVDSLADGTIVRFVRVLQVTSGLYRDFQENYEGDYTVTGRVFTCSSWEELENARAEQESAFCQCEYEIMQENWLVTDIRGGTIQNYTVSFDEVVTEKCTGELVPREVLRNEIKQTYTINASFSQRITFNFTTAGQEASKLTVRLYLSVSSFLDVVIDLDPATAQSTYPDITINPASLTYSGSNLAALQAEYFAIIQHALEKAKLDNNILDSFVNPISVSSSGSSFTFSARRMHLPTFPYIHFHSKSLFSDFSPNPDYNYTGTATLSTSVSISPVTTSTNSYTPSTCTSVDIQADYGETYIEPTDNPLFWAAVTGNTFLFSDPISPNLSLSSTIYGICEVEPIVCDNLPSNVQLDGCIELCDQVSNYVSSCMADVQDDGNIVRFQRLFDASTGNSIDRTSTLSDLYTPIGIVTSCEEADRAIQDTFKVSIIQEDCNIRTPGIELLASTNATYNSGEYHSVSYSVVSGTLTITIGLSVVTIPEGLSGTWTAPGPCDRLQESIAFDASGTSVITSIR